MEKLRNKIIILFMFVLANGLAFSGCKKETAPLPQKPVTEQKTTQKGPVEQGPSQPDTSVKVEEKVAEEQGVFRYESLGLLDPFEPVIGKQEIASPTSPLEQYSLDQLKLVGIIWGVSEPRAMVEDPSGIGYIIKKGTKIGKNHGVVIKILDSEVVILETYVDLMNRRKTNEVSLKLQK